MIRLRFLFDEIDERVGLEGSRVPLLSVSIHRGVIPRSEMTDRESRADDFASCKRVAPGDIVINRMRAFEGGAGISSLEGMVSGDYAVLRTNPGLDPRFFHHLIRSRWFVGEMTARLRGIGGVDAGNVRTPRINVEDLGAIPVSLPSLAEQRAIADYLDAETARIDSIVSARSRQVALMRERADVAITERLHAGGTPLVPLGRVVDLVAGFSFQSEDFLPDGGPIRLLRGINVDVGSTRWDETLWVGQDVAQATSRFGLAPGDVVMGMDRPVISTGVRVAQVTSADLPAMLVQCVARLRARTRVSQDYLYLALRAPGLAAHFEPMFTGVSVPHVSPSQILTYEIPVPAPAAQAEIVGSIRAIDDHARTCEAATRLQVDLLLERRQALITAAVTGQLEIPGVAA